MERRNFLKGTLGTLYMMATPNMAFPDTKITEKRLLIVLLRRGMPASVQCASIAAGGSTQEGVAGASCVPRVGKEVVAAECRKAWDYKREGMQWAFVSRTLAVALPTDSTHIKGCFER